MNEVTKNPRKVGRPHSQNHPDKGAMHAIRQAIDSLGGCIETARKLERGESAVYRWYRTGVVSMTIAPILVEWTDGLITFEELCPHLFLTPEQKAQIQERKEMWKKWEREKK